jgi:nucleotide-binding universal stress UspA family protein
MASAQPLERHVASPFSRIVVGVDGTEPSYDACSQAARLLAPTGEIEVFSAVYLAGSTFGRWSPGQIATELEHEAGQSLERARHIVGPAGASRLVDGPAAESLLHELERRRATLVAVGSHGHSRAFELSIGSVAVAMLRDAPCSVLVARPCADAGAFPRSIVLGVDGSAASNAALAAAQALTARFDASLRVIAALRGKDLDLAAVLQQAPLVDTVEKHPVSALVDASKAVDLLIVGGRGLHGIAALGSVTERVAHGAHCSVLVVR